jgi:hypothetical protein
MTGYRLIELRLSDYFAKTVRQLSWANVFDGHRFQFASLVSNRYVVTAKLRSHLVLTPQF